MNLIKKILYLALVLLIHVEGINASELEKLVMPGELARVHEKFEAECEKCHQSFKKMGQNNLCMDCHDHANIKKDVSKGSGYHGKIKNIKSIECNTCHTDHRGRDEKIINFTPGMFDHDKTDFRLKDKHVGLECRKCHSENKKYHEAKGQCVACHSKSEPHKGKLGKKCENCHSESTWNQIVFDHNKSTKFDLLNKHKNVNCNVCHINNKYEGTPKKCYACHYVNDIHNGSQGKKCDSCHSVKSWKTVKFDHDKKTKFPLKWKHADILCDSCHESGSFEDKLKTNCNSCHNKDDAHKGRYGPKCSSCHRDKSWKLITFRHNRDTKFDLNGAHTKLQCNDCHRTDLKGLHNKSDCYDCHSEVDIHKGDQGKKCDQCHVEDGWDKKLSFDHDLTSFPLLGQHAVLVCEECHISKNYILESSKCDVCHEKNDIHDGRYGKECELCHNPNDWKIWLFDHDEQTNFIIDGAHKKLSCDDCHTRRSRSDVKISKTCDGCHRVDDVHRGGFGRQCHRCHKTSSFSDDISY